MHLYYRLLITVLLFLWSFGELTLREMETPTKTVLVNMGDNTRVVTFATSSDVDDAAGHGLGNARPHQLR